MAALRYYETVGPDGVEIGLVGPIRRGSAHLLRGLVEPHRCRTVQLDLAQCSGVDLDGMLALATAHQVTAASGGGLVLCRVPPSIADYLRDHHMEHLLACADATSTGPEQDPGRPPSPAR